MPRLRNIQSVTSSGLEHFHWSITLPAFSRKLRWHVGGGGARMPIGSARLEIADQVSYARDSDEFYL